MSYLSQRDAQLLACRFIQGSAESPGDLPMHIIHQVSALSDFDIKRLLFAVGVIAGAMVTSLCEQTSTSPEVWASEVEARLRAGRPPVGG